MEAASENAAVAEVYQERFETSVELIRGLSEKKTADAVSEEVSAVIGEFPTLESARDLLEEAESVGDVRKRAQSIIEAAKPARRTERQGDDLPDSLLLESEDDAGETRSGGGPREGASRAAQIAHSTVKKLKGK